MGRPLIVPPGLAIVPDAITEAGEAQLVAWIEQTTARPFGGRSRLDLYGAADSPFIQTSGGRWVSETFPPILADLALALCGAGCTAITISEYAPGEGVREHTDRAEAGPVIRTLSLLADADLVFRKQIPQRADPADLERDIFGGGSRAQVFERHVVPFPRRSLMQMRDPCRSAPWTHELAPVSERRMSIAFRGFAATSP